MTAHRPYVANSCFISVRKSSHSCLVLPDARCFRLTPCSISGEFIALSWHRVATLCHLKVKQMLIDLFSLFLLSLNFKTDSCCPIRNSRVHLPTSPCTSSAPNHITQPLRLVWDNYWLNCQCLRSIQNIIVACMGRSLVCHFTPLLTYKPHFFLGLQDRIQRADANSKPLFPLNAAIMCYLKHTEQEMTWNLISLQGSHALFIEG